MSYDGTEFKALDEEAFKDQFSEDQPLDVWLEQRIRSNTLYLARGRDTATVPYLTNDSALTSDSGDRYWATRTLARHALWPIEVDRGFEGVEVSFLLAVDTAGSSGTGVNFELRITDWTGEYPVNHRVLGKEEFSVAGTSGAFEEHTATVELDAAPWTGNPRVLYLELWMYGDDAGDSSSDIECEWLFRNTLRAKTTFSGSDFVLHYIQNDDTSENYDVWSLQGGKVLDVYPPVRRFNDTQDFSIRHLWWAQIRSVSIRLFYNSRIRTGLPSAAELAAQKAVTSVTATPQVQGAINTASQVRHVAIGPTGFPTGVETSEQPWYLWRASPLREVIMQGIAIQDHARIEAFVVWANESGVEAESTVTVSISGLSSGDADWGDATLLASGNVKVTSSYDGEGSLVQQALGARYAEGAGIGSYELPRDSLTWPIDKQIMNTARVPLSFVTGTASDWRRPLELEITISNVATDPTFGGTIGRKIIAYSLITRAR